MRIPSKEILIFGFRRHRIRAQHVIQLQNLLVFGLFYLAMNCPACFVKIIGSTTFEYVLSTQLGIIFSCIAQVLYSLQYSFTVICLWQGILTAPKKQPQFASVSSQAEILFKKTVMLLRDSTMALSRITITRHRASAPGVGLQASAR